uniref:Uncharacterized protein n=1 Tax=Rhizophora mucronata TaxID=61149 RepID=A0A2P2PEX0_RHIMU
MMRNQKEVFIIRTCLDLHNLCPFQKDLGISTTGLLYD